MRKGIRKTLLWIGGIVIFLCAAVVLIIGTESGTRWVIHQAVGYVDGLETRDIRGTLLTKLEFGYLGFASPDATLALADLEINFAWSRSSRRRIVLQQLSASEIRYQSFSVANNEGQPLEIMIPDIPIALVADAINVQMVIVDEARVAGITISTLDLNNEGLGVAEAAASFAEIETGISDLSIRFDDDLSVTGHIEWQYLGGEWSGNANIDGSLIQLRFQHELLQPYVVSAVGSVKLLQQIQPVIDATIRMNDWQYEEWTVADSELIVNGTTSDYLASVTATVMTTIATGRVLSADIQVKGNGSTEGVDDLEVTAQSSLGLVAASGTIAWLPDPMIDLQITGKDIDPADFLTLAPGKFDARISVLATSPSDFSVDVASLTGTYNNQSVRARGKFSAVDAAFLCTACELSAGQNNITIDGSLNDRSLATTFAIDATSLEQLWPGIGGSITADGELRGSVDLPVFTVNAAGDALFWRDMKIESFAIQGRNTEAGKVYLQLDIDGLSQGDFVFGGGHLLAEGDLEAVDVQTDWAVNEISATARAIIALADDAVIGTVSRASLTEPYSGTWSLSEPLEFSARADEILVAANSWGNGDAMFRHERFVMEGGELQAGATLSNIPLHIANNILPDNVRLAGSADVDVSLQQKDASWTGSLQWNQRDTKVWLSRQGLEDYEVGVPVLNVTARLDTMGATARAEFAVDAGLSGVLEMAADDLSPESALRARLQFSGNEWDWVPVLLPDVDNVQGEISADISAEGSLDSPLLSGELRWQQGQLAIPPLNALLADIDITVAATADGNASISGQAMAGGGPLLLDGRIENFAETTRSFNVGIKGDNAELLNWQNYQVTASPDIRISGNTTAVEFTGGLDIDSAEIVVRELPEGAVRPSSDIVVAGETVEVKSGVLLLGDIELILSEEVHIEAFGLDSHLEGNLRFSQREPGNPRARGELRLIDGFFGAYGQQLQIEEGTLTFTGPIDDPIVNVRAVREVETLSGTVTAGIELRGRAKNPSSTLFSDPAMSETDILSYLVLGQPMQDATTADGSMVADAAFALGVRQAALITNQIGQSMGLDQLTIEGSNQSTTALVAGKQINRRLYARYAYGVFTQIGNLLLRYQLSERFTIEVGAGDSQSMDLLYIVEKE